jgi:hypothetical protein
VGANNQKFQFLFLGSGAKKDVRDYSSCPLPIKKVNIAFKIKS